MSFVRNYSLCVIAMFTTDLVYNKKKSLISIDPSSNLLFVIFKILYINKVIIKYKIFLKFVSPYFVSPKCSRGLLNR